MKDFLEGSEFYEEQYKIILAQRYKEDPTLKKQQMKISIHSNILLNIDISDLCRKETFKNGHWAACLYWTIITRYYQMINNVILAAYLRNPTPTHYGFTERGQIDKNKIIVIEEDLLGLFQNKLLYIQIEANNRSQDYKILKKLFIESKLEEINNQIYQTFDVHISFFVDLVLSWRNDLSDLWAIPKLERFREYSVHPEESYLKANNSNLFNEILNCTEAELPKKEISDFIQYIVLP